MFNDIFLDSYVNKYHQQWEYIQAIGSNKLIEFRTHISNY